MTDFYSQNRCVCSTRSHGPLLCAFCLSFHFNNRPSQGPTQSPCPTSGVPESDTEIDTHRQLTTLS